MFHILSQGCAELGLFHVALQSDRYYRVNSDECNEHDNARQWRYQRRRRRRRGGVIIVVVSRGERPQEGGRGRNDEYDNVEDNDEDGIHVRRKVVDVSCIGEGLGTTGSDKQ